MHLCVQHAAMQMYWNKRKWLQIKKKLNSHRIGLEHQHGRHIIVFKHQYGCHDILRICSIFCKLQCVLECKVKQGTHYLIYRYSQWKQKLRRNCSNNVCSAWSDNKHHHSHDQLCFNLMNYWRVWEGIMKRRLFREVSLYIEATTITCICTRGNEGKLLSEGMLNVFTHRDHHQLPPHIEVHIKCYKSQINSL